MLALYKGSVEFMLSQDRMLGDSRPNKEASQLARVKHFTSNLPSLGQDMADAQAVLAELEKESPAFTDAQRKSMVEAVASHMDSDATTTADIKSQNHPYVHEYMPDRLWKKLRDKTISWDTKKEDFVDFALETLGLRHPNNDTLKSMLAILWVCAERDLSPDDAYEELRNMQDKFVNKRELVPGKPLLKEYTRDVSQFIRLYPHQYLECDPPVASQIDERKIQQKTRKDVMPSRSSNKHIAKSARQSATCDPAAGLQRSFMNFILGNSSSLVETPRRPAPRGPPAIGNVPADAARKSPVAPLAIADGRTAVDPLELQANLPPCVMPEEATAPCGIAAIVQSAKSVLGKLKKADKKKGKKRKSCSVSSGSVSAAEDADDDVDDADSGEEVVMKKPAVKKRPAAGNDDDDDEDDEEAVTKKPATKMATVEPSTPKPTFDKPLHWGGGRIYYSEKKGSWRVYRRCEDKVEKTIKVDKSNPVDIKKNWNKALKLIKRDPRPV